MVATLGQWIDKAITREEEEMWKEKAQQLLEAAERSDDKVKSPNHYTVGGIETIDYIRAKLTREQVKGYYLGNLLKYLSRASHKDGLQDYKKAEVYLKWLIELESKDVQKR
jgi:hypothetical protein